MKGKDFKEDVEKLISLGKSKGYLTYDEVNSALSNEVDSSEEIDQVFEILDGKDIKVVDSEGDLDTENDSSESTEDEIRRLREEQNKEENIYSEKFIPLDDPVKMYLKQMGSIPLLSRENEINLAKRIEEAELKFAEALYLMAYARKEALKSINRVLNEEINVEDVVKDELERRPKLMRDLTRLRKRVSQTPVGSKKSAEILAQFKLTASFNEDIVARIRKMVNQIEKIERSLKNKRGTRKLGEVAQLKKEKTKLIRELGQPINVIKARLQDIKIH